MALVLGLIVGLLLWLGNLKPDRYHDPRVRRKPKIKTKAMVEEGILLTLEDVVLIDDFEEEVLDDAEI